MTTQTEALKLALEQTLEMLTDNREYIEANERSEYLAMYDKAIAGAEKALAEQPAPVQQESVACPVCNQVHTILDADESQIIRNAKDGYPDGRTPRLLTLQERVTALRQYASDWKRWCLEKENTTPQAQPAPEIAIADAYRAGVDSGIAAEREACARVCDDWAKTSAKIIRARGNT